jgi:hypothetical protein
MECADAYQQSEKLAMIFLHIVHFFLVGYPALCPPQSCKIFEGKDVFHLG